MSCLGVHFALISREVSDLIAIEDENLRLKHLQEVVEVTYFTNYPEFMVESEKAWDAIHRSLSDGELTWEGGGYPLSHVILGGESLYNKPNYIMSLKKLAVVSDINKALERITQNELELRYFAIDEASYGMETTEEDFEYTWTMFQAVRDFYQRAAKAKRSVLFSVDQ